MDFCDSICDLPDLGGHRVEARPDSVGWNDEEWWLEPELNQRHKDFQSSALPTELSSQPIAAPTLSLLQAHQEGERVRGI